MTQDSSSRQNQHEVPASSPALRRGDFSSGSLQNQPNGSRSLSRHSPFVQLVLQVFEILNGETLNLPEMPASTPALRSRGSRSDLPRLRPLLFRVETILEGKMFGRKYWVVTFKKMIAMASQDMDPWLAGALWGTAKHMAKAIIFGTRFSGTGELRPSLERVEGHTFLNRSIHPIISNLFSEALQQLSEDVALHIALLRWRELEVTEITRSQMFQKVETGLKSILKSFPF
jgi:hypothetical protein